MRLYIMLAYLMLFAALSNAVCLYYAFLPLIFVNAFCFHALSWFIGLFHVLFCVMLSDFNLLVFPNSMFTLFFLMTGQCALWRNST